MGCFPVVVFKEIHFGPEAAFSAPIGERVWHTLARIRAFRSWREVVSQFDVRAWLKSLCENLGFSSGHDFSRAVTAAISKRLQPLRFVVPSYHTDSSATPKKRRHSVGFSVCVKTLVFRKGTVLTVPEVPQNQWGFSP